MKGFQRISLKAGQNQTVSFKLATEDLRIADDQGNVRPFTGKVTVSVGGSHPDEARIKKQTVVQSVIER